MISLKHYLDLETPRIKNAEENPSNSVCPTLLSAYRACLVEMGECGAEACPTLGMDLARGITRVLEALGPAPALDAIACSEAAVRDHLRSWALRTAQHYDQRTLEVKDLLLVLARTAESLSNRDDRYARQLDSVTSQLESIATLDDVARIRTSIERKARELKLSIAQMTAESKAVIDHLRVEVSTCQARLLKAEYVASLDSLTGLGSRHWIEGRIQQRIESGFPFAILLMDIRRFGLVVEDYGNLVGDLLLKEFAKELRSSCRFSDIVGRWSGDEFIVVLDHCGPEMEAHVARLHASVAKPYHVPGRTGYVNVPLEVSTGMAEYRPGEHLQNLLQRADADLCLNRASAPSLKTA